MILPTPDSSRNRRSQRGLANSTLAPPGCLLSHVCSPRCRYLGIATIEGDGDGGQDSSSWAVKGESRRLPWFPGSEFQAALLSLYIIERSLERRRRYSYRHSPQLPVLRGHRSRACPRGLQNSMSDIELATTNVRSTAKTHGQLQGAYYRVLVCRLDNSMGIPDSVAAGASGAYFRRFPCQSGTLNLVSLLKRLHVGTTCQYKQY